MVPARLSDHLAGFRQLAVASPLSGEIHDHGARLHGGDHLSRDQPRRRSSRNERRRDHDVLCLDMPGNQLFLLRLVGLRHRLGITSGCLGLAELRVLDCDELGAERGDLLLGRRAHVGRGDDAAESSRRRDRLQTGDADTHDEHLRGRHRARRRHHHRHGLMQHRSCIDHRLVARKVRLARENVHRLRARDPRHEFHSHQRSAGAHERVETGSIIEWRQDRHHEATGVETLELVRFGPSHLQQDVRSADRLGRAADDRGARRCQRLVSDSGGRSGTSHHPHCGAEPDQFFH